MHMPARPSLVMLVAAIMARFSRALALDPIRPLTRLRSVRVVARPSRLSTRRFGTTGDADGTVRDGILDELRRITGRTPLPSLSELRVEIGALAALAEATLAKDTGLKGLDSSAGESAAVVVASMTVAKLKDALRARSLSTSGLKADLVDRLTSADVGSVATQTEGRQAVVFPGDSHCQLDDWLSQSNPALDAELAAVAKRFAGQGAQTGVFTDGSSRPNPGPGGWAAVAVLNGRVLWRAAGGDDVQACTNNKMEITALLEALRRLPAGQADADALEDVNTIYSDSDLCVKTLNTWAAGWERKGWIKSDKKTPANLALVQEAHALFQARPGINVQWVRAHDGSCWNEYVDVLADAARKSAAAHSPMHSP